MQAASAARSHHLDAARQALKAAQRVKKQGTRRDPAQGTALGGVRATLLLRDNLRNRSGIERAYLRAIAQARVEVIIATA